MTLQIKYWAHSSEKDHTVMTGGTLKIDKEVQSDQGLQVYTYAVKLFPNADESSEFHKSMHTNEHLFAYSKDTGSIRASVSDIIDGFEGKNILDVSPYKFPNGGYGFRITSVAQIAPSIVTLAVKKSVEKAIHFLEGLSEGRWDPIWYMGIPFANEKQCGQFDFHSPSQAKAELTSIAENFEVVENRLDTPHTQMVVCDLRLLRPKLDWKDDMITFSPHISYMISEEIEKKLPQKIPNTLTVVGTFWCMTWMYLWVSMPQISPEHLAEIHKAIMEIISEIDTRSMSEGEKSQITTVLENYKNFSGK